jgi:hypothetical protein
MVSAKQYYDIIYMGADKLWLLINNLLKYYNSRKNAEVAQLVEQLIRNQ